MNPSNLITAGTLTLTGTDKDNAVPTEVLDCSAGAGEFTTAGIFKTLTSVVAASFNNLTTGDEKVWVRTGRKAELQDLILPKDYTSIMLRFYPALTELVSVEVFGLFWSDNLVADADTNFWTERYPELLIWETMLHLEVPVRNREGMRDFEEAINNKLELLNKEHVRFTTARVPRTMRG
jgi:hypothetical protein